MSGGREALGRLVREEWIAWASEQPDPKPSWLVPWQGLADPDREVDRRIGERLHTEGATAEAERAYARILERHGDLDPDAEGYSVEELVDRLMNAAREAGRAEGRQAYAQEAIDAARRSYQNGYRAALDAVRSGAIVIDAGGRS